jgi:hypothetical protein
MARALSVDAVVRPIRTQEFVVAEPTFGIPSKNPSSTPCRVEIYRPRVDLQACTHED